MPLDDDTAEEHLEWAKVRALDELRVGGVRQATGLLMSDLIKHSATVPTIEFMQQMYSVLRKWEQSGDSRWVRRWIEDLALQDDTADRIPGANMPNFWLYDPSGKLSMVVRRYVERRSMSPVDVAVMRAYLRQWINGDWHNCALLDALRTKVAEIRTRQDITDWLIMAEGQGIDPL